MFMPRQARLNAPGALLHAIIRGVNDVPLVFVVTRAGERVEKEMK